MPNYLVLMKSQRTEKPVAGNRPSPEQMQQMFAAYKAWMAQFKDNIVNMGDKLLPGGRGQRPAPSAGALAHRTVARAR